MRNGCRLISRFCPPVFAALLAIGVGQPLHAQSAGMDGPGHAHDAAQAEPSHELLVSAGGKTKTFRLADLAAMPQKTLVVHNGHNDQDETYTGVSVADLMARLGLSLENGGANPVYHTYLRAEGTDGYWVLYSAAELQPKLHTVDSIVAITVDGHTLGEHGDFMIIGGGERKPARWVRNLRALRFITLD